MPRPEPDPWGGPKEAPIRKVAQTSKFIRVPKTPQGAQLYCNLVYNSLEP